VSKPRGSSTSQPAVPGQACASNALQGKQRPDSHREPSTPRKCQHPPPHTHPTLQDMQPTPTKPPQTHMYMCCYIIQSFSTSYGWQWRPSSLAVRVGTFGNAADSIRPCNTASASDHTAYCPHVCAASASDHTPETPTSNLAGNCTSYGSSVAMHDQQCSTVPPGSTHQHNKDWVQHCQPGTPPHSTRGDFPRLTVLDAASTSTSQQQTPTCPPPPGDVPRLGIGCRQHFHLTAAAILHTALKATNSASL
jgi:hypothetical protein